METVAIALGANLGDKISSLQATRDAIKQLAVNNKLTQACLYSSAPIDCPKQSPDFFNTVVTILYTGTPELLLQHTQEIETAIGRKKKIIHNEARLIDIDLLYFGRKEIKTPRLTLPHPRLHERRFVLEPLNEINPSLIPPRQSLTVRQLLEQKHIQQQQLHLIKKNW